MLGEEHIEIDGETYRLAQTGEGTHYDQAGEPLRPPNALGVQGEQGKFQVRPDLLLWRLTDWSGGEGKVKYDPQSVNQHLELHKVDPFSEPGKLFPGPLTDITTFAAAASFDHAVWPVRAAGGLWGVSMNDNKVYQWDDNLRIWLAAQTNGLQTAGAGYGVHGDGDGLFYCELGGQAVYKYDGAFTVIESGTISTSANSLCGLNEYVYVVDSANGQVWEIAKAGGSTTSIDEPTLTLLASGSAVSAQRPMIVPGDNKVYTILVVSGDTYIREITPTNAAGEGFGAQIAHLNGFEAQAAWWFNGTLFIAGSNRQLSKDEVVLYIRPGESLGSIGRVRPGLSSGILGGSEGNGNMLLHSFAASRTSGQSDAVSYTGLWLVDAITGGLSLYTASDNSAYDDHPVGPVEYNGQWFWSSDTSGTKKTFVTSPSDFVEESYFTSPLHDFDLAEEKVLSSLRLVLEDVMPTDWQIKLYYGLDTATPDTLALTMSAGDGNSKAVAVSSASTPVVFDHLSLRAEFSWSGAGTPSTKPVLLQVEARAQLAEVPKRFRFLIDCSDHHSSQRNGYNGAKKIEKLKTAIAKSVVELKDGYTSRSPKSFDTHNVVIDNYRFILEKPGEGFAYVEMVEVL